MKIVYVTTALDKEDYKEFVKLWKKSPNPSNQNFHNKMIRSLAINNQVEVISIRPFSGRLCTVKKLEKGTKVDGNITWNYITIRKRKVSRYLAVRSEYRKIFKKTPLDDAIILCDTINPLCISAATYIGKQHDLPVIGVCTDSPSNITGTRKQYTIYLLNHAYKCQGYITLIDGLNLLYNPNDKPYLTIEGIVENERNVKVNLNIEKPYFYFGGSLLERYGVFNLIQAYEDLNNPNVDLYIAGHNGYPEDVKERIKDNPNIHFLGTIGVDEVLAYQAGAVAIINPRPYTEDLDRFSIPSKTLEALTSGVPTISIKNTKLQEIFKDEIVWVEDNEVSSLTAAMQKVLDMSPDERTAFASKGKEKVQELYSLDSVNKKIMGFLPTFSNKS